MMTQQAKRYIRLDELRGLTLISMILYHFLWDLVYIAGIDISWYGDTAGYIWQQSICWTFIFLSGFCWSLGRRRLRRGLTVFLAGGLVTAVTLIFIPENRVVFGVLTCLGSCMLLLIPLDRLFSRITNQTALTGCLAACLACFILLKDVNRGCIPPFSIGGNRFSLPKGLYSGWLSTYLGFPMKEFYSTDYFSLFPWIFLFLAGYFFYRRMLSQDGEGKCFSPWFDSLLRTCTIPFVNALGRRSLLIYLLHQPVLYGVTQLIILSRRY